MNKKNISTKVCELYLLDYEKLMAGCRQREYSVARIVIIKILLELGHSQSEIARHLNVNRSTISRALDSNLVSNAEFKKMLFRCCSK